MGHRRTWPGANRLGIVATLVVPVVLLGITASLQARTWHVPSECSGISAGLDSASYGDTVLVAPGVYLTSDDLRNWVTPGPGEVLISESGPEVTIIEFCNSSRGVGLTRCEGARVSGFTVRFGSGPECSPPPVPTKGVWCWNCTDVVVEDCIIENVCYGVLVEGTSSEWWKPVIRNNVIRGCLYGVACIDMVDPGRPYIQGNMISDCRNGGYFDDSAPMIDGNQVTDSWEWGLYFIGNCTASCDRNTIAYNPGGVYVYADPPLGTPDFNGSWEPALANDFYGNTGYDISYNHGPGSSGMMAIYNYWGSRCPDFAPKLEGDIRYSPWMDSTHTVVIYPVDCPGATEPTTWGAIKAMYK